MKRLFYIMIIIISAVITEVVLVVTSVNSSEEICLLENKISISESKLKEIQGILNKAKNEGNNLTIKLNKKDKEIIKILSENKKIQENIAKENIRIAMEKQKEKNIISKIKKIEVEKKTTYYESNKPLIKTVYLTFDDGPSKNTYKILKILNENNIKATFFVNGKYSNNPDEAYKAIVQNGHSIGNHTYSHEYETIYGNIEQFVKDFNKLQVNIKKSIGFKPQLVRFPGGSNNTISHNYGGANIMADLSKFMIMSGYTYFDWNVDCSDANALVQDKNKIVQSVLKHSKSNNSLIVLMHDSEVKTTTVEALPEIIQKLKKEGFQFKNLSPNDYTIQFLRANF